MAADRPQSETHTRLLALYDAAVAAAHPDVCLPAHLPSPPENGRLTIVGAGKAAAAMAVAAEAHYAKLGVLDRVGGFTTAPHGTPEALTGVRPSVIEIVSARHPTPDEASVRAAERALGLIAAATERDLVLVLLSGGASALWPARADPANETPKPGDAAFASAAYRIIATPAAALAAATALAKRQGYEAIDLGDAVTGEAREVAKAHAKLAREAKAAGRRAAIISGGELAVTVRNAHGRGG